MKRRRYGWFVILVALVGLVAWQSAALEAGAGEQGSKPPGPRARRGKQRPPDLLKAGDVATDFKLKSLDGKHSTKLSSYRGKQPVALIFGSYT